MEWLPGNGPAYTALETCDFGRSVGLLVRTSPPYSPESNGMVEAIVKGFERGDVYVSRWESTQSVLAQLPDWMLDHNIGMRSPREYRSQAAGGSP